MALNFHTVKIANYTTASGFWKDIFENRMIIYNH